MKAAAFKRPLVTLADVPVYEGTSEENPSDRHVQIDY